MAPKKDKGKDGKIKLSLYINKTAYKFGCVCTFCSKEPAILHCAECPDFFCNACDITAHNTKKRATHIRQTMSKLDLKKAAGLVTRYTRLVQHLKVSISSPSVRPLSSTFPRHTVFCQLSCSLFVSLTHSTPLT